MPITIDLKNKCTHSPEMCSLSGRQIPLKSLKANPYIDHVCIFHHYLQVENGEREGPLRHLDLSRANPNTARKVTHQMTPKLAGVARKKGCGIPLTLCEESIHQLLINSNLFRPSLKQAYQIRYLTLQTICRMDEQLRGTHKKIEQLRAAKWNQALALQVLLRRLSEKNEPPIRELQALICVNLSTAKYAQTLDLPAKLSFAVQYGLTHFPSSWNLRETKRFMAETKITCMPLVFALDGPQNVEALPILDLETDEIQMRMLRHAFSGHNAASFLLPTDLTAPIMRGELAHPRASFISVCIAMIKINPSNQSIHISKEVISFCQYPNHPFLALRDYANLSESESPPSKDEIKALVSHLRRLFNRELCGQFITRASPSQSAPLSPPFDHSECNSTTSSYEVMPEGDIPHRFLWDPSITDQENINILVEKFPNTKTYLANLTLGQA